MGGGTIQRGHRAIAGYTEVRLSGFSKVQQWGGGSLFGGPL